MTDHSENIQRWATEGGGEGDPAASSSDIRDYIETELQQLGTLHYFEGDIPDTASARPNGVFFDVDDLRQYLESGGLVFIDPITGMNVPNPIVHIYRSVDEDDGSIEYEIYIDDES